MLVTGGAKIHFDQHYCLKVSGRGGFCHELQYFSLQTKLHSPLGLGEKRLKNIDKVLNFLLYQHLILFWHLILHYRKKIILSVSKMPLKYKFWTSYKLCKKEFTLHLIIVFILNLILINIFNYNLYNFRSSSLQV